MENKMHYHPQPVPQSNAAIYVGIALLIAALAYTIWDRFPNWWAHFRRRQRVKRAVRDYIDQTPGW
jgi:hypothetical protein